MLISSKSQSIHPVQPPAAITPATAMPNPQAKVRKERKIQAGLGTDRGPSPRRKEKFHRGGFGRWGLPPTAPRRKKKSPEGGSAHIRSTPPPARTEGGISLCTGDRFFRGVIPITGGGGRARNTIHRSVRRRCGSPATHPGNPGFHGNSIFPNISLHFLVFPCISFDFHGFP